MMDDVLVYGKTAAEHDKRLLAVMEKISAAGVTLNPKKCQFSQRQLKFLGHIVNEQGIQADPDKTAAISDMPAPTNISELCRFMGMVNQLGKFSMNVADFTQPLQQLLSRKATWIWGPPQEQALAKIKKRAHEAYYSRTLQSSFPHKNLFRCICLRTRCRSHATKGISVVSSSICLQINIRDGTKICANRKRGASCYLGL